MSMDNNKVIILAKQLIKEFEGLSLMPYRCSAGILTIGYGHVIKPSEKQDFILNNPINKNTADHLLSQDIEIAKKSLYRNCSVYLTDNQQAALISFIFNLGFGAFQFSTMRQKLNRGEYDNEASEFTRWIYARGVKIKGLLRRRLIEQKLFMQNE